MTRQNLLPTIIAAVIGIAGVLLLLFAWHLPPFAPSQPTTENAYIRGNVTTIAPQLSGHVSAVEVADFQSVREGQVIARLDDRIFRQRLAQAEAGLAGARAALEVAQQDVVSAEAGARADEAALRAARSALATARASRDRAAQLRDRGVASQSAADQSETALQQAQAAVTQAQSRLDVQRETINSARVALSARKAEIAGAEAAVQLARIDLDNTAIRAPADGRLGQISVRVGQYVAAGTGLVSHVGSDVWIIANFKETGLHGLREGERVRFTVDALQGRAFTGRVQSFSPATASEYSLLAGNNATGNFTKIAQRLPVRISIDPGQEMAQYLAPGLSVVVEVDTGDAPAG
ncbi:HlyD family secretion protein [Paracoccus siganidrum]|uniref:HlyD family secretion protein n=1 Tax=Paracoccus siganidrum TaxID=1276757 RepID=A0A418ZVT3_9RHOB|nr:HlyD family secretion protein [Paracoccus siganidrum]RJL04077.1 HlyD family secretion protein [Paracoccus siganidrum]RMC35880.1 HlyD family secretion protein [Paracoccus siganidrum]